MEAICDSPDPKFPGAFPASPGESDPSVAAHLPPDVYKSAKSYVLDLTEKTKLYLPQAVARHLPESHPDPDHQPDDRVRKANSKQVGSIPGSHDENGAPSGNLETEHAQVEDDTEFVEDIIPADPASAYRPKEGIICEQEREETLTELELIVPPPSPSPPPPPPLPPILISNRHLSGNRHFPGAAAPTLATGVAEGHLLADYLGPPAEELEPVPESPGKQDAPETRSQLEPHAEGPSADPANQPTNDNQTHPYKPHPLENIQEKTRDNRLPPVLPASDDVPPSSGEAGAGTEGVLSKLKRGRRRSSGTGPEEAPQRSSVDTPEERVQEKKEDVPPTPKKVGLMGKIKGEIKVVTGELQRNKEKVEAGKRMKEGL